MRVYVLFKLASAKQMLSSSFIEIMDKCIANKVGKDDLDETLCLVS